MERLTDTVYAPGTFCQQESDSRKSLQLGVLRLGLLEDGDVEVGVFPEGEQPSIDRNHDLFLTQKIKVSVTAGARIDDCRKVA